MAIKPSNTNSYRVIIKNASHQQLFDGVVEGDGLNAPDKWEVLPKDLRIYGNLIRAQRVGLENTFLLTVENMFDIEGLVKNANKAKRQLALLESSEKNNALVRIAEVLESEKAAILAANQLDMEEGEKMQLGNKLDRLLLTEERIDGIIKSIHEVITLPDPVGELIDETVRPDGREVSRVRCPIGVVGMIYEARPNVTVDASVLCLKTGNAVILRGGKDAIHTNRILTELICQALDEEGISSDAVQLIDSTDREDTKRFLQQKQGVDVIIPRGGKGLISFVKETSTIPVIETGASVVHVYVDKAADTQKAVDIVVNSKTHRVSVCNALDTLLVHESVAQEFLPKLAEALKRHSEETETPLVNIYIENNVRQQIGDYENLTELNPENDYDEEFLDYRMSIKIVTDMDEALDHIEEHSLKHTECIVTDDDETADRFSRSVDSACVGINTSTRYSDGGEYGLGAEIGISTSKIGPRGPFALEGLTTYKWINKGDGQIRP